MSDFDEQCDQQNRVADEPQTSGPAYDSSFFSYTDQANARSAEPILTAVTRHFDIKSVVDFGCGQGRVAVPFARRGFAVTGVDTSRDWLAVARAWAELEGVDA